MHMPCLFSFISLVFIRNSIWCEFPSFLKDSFNFSCCVNLLVMKSFSLCMSINVIIQLIFQVFFFFLAGSKHRLEKAMAPHSSTLAWKIPWMEEPGGLQSMGSHRIRHDWSDLAAAAAAASIDFHPDFFHSQSFKNVASLISHFHFFWWEIWHKLYFCFRNVLCLFCLAALWVFLFLFFVFNGLEQFNYNGTGHGFLPVSCAHSSFGSFDWWVHNFHYDWSIFCCVSSSFLSSKNFSWIFRDSNHSYIRPFKVALPSSGAMFIFFFFF